MYNSYYVAELVRNQVFELQKTMAGDNSEPKTIMSYSEFKNPTQVKNEENTHMLSDEEKEEIRNHTKNFGKGKGEKK